MDFSFSAADWHGVFGVVESGRLYRFQGHLHGVPGLPHTAPYLLRELCVLNGQPSNDDVWLAGSLDRFHLPVAWD